MIHGHGGDIYALAEELGCDAAHIIDMSSNINPLGMPPGLPDALKAQMDAVGLLPQADSRAVIESMADLLAVAPGRMLAGNGTTQFIYNTCPALATAKALIIGPTYADYADACLTESPGGRTLLVRRPELYGVLVDPDRDLSVGPLPNPQP